jgi:molybdopterin converting factor small subunit
MLAFSEINNMKMSNKEVGKYADSLLLARGIDPSYMNTQTKAMTLYGDMVDGQLKQMMERRNRIVKDYMSFNHQDIPEGAFDISPVVIEDSKEYLGKDRYTVTLIVDEQEVELPTGDEGEVVEDIVDDFAEEQETTTEATEPAENIVEGAQEGTIVAAEDNLSEQSALSSDEQTE